MTAASARTARTLASARTALGLRSSGASIAALRATAFGVGSPYGYAPLYTGVRDRGRFSYFYTAGPYGSYGWLGSGYWGFGFGYTRGNYGFYWGTPGYCGWYGGWNGGWWGGWYRPWCSSWYPYYYGYAPVVSYIWDPWSWYYPYWGTTYVINRSYYYPEPEAVEEVVYDGYLEAKEEPVSAVQAPSSAGVRIVSREEEMPDEAFFDSLKPAELSLALGVIHFRSGEYEKAAESLYNAAVDAPDAPVPSIVLAEALFAIGEYKYAGQYLRKGLDGMPEIRDYDWDPRALYGKGRKADFEAHLAAIREHLKQHADDADAALVAGFILFYAGEVQEAERLFDVVIRAKPGDPHAAAFRAAAGKRRSGEGVPLRKKDLSPAATFLRTFRLRDIPRLGL